MANTSVWAKPDPGIAAAQKAQMALGPEPASTVWAPMDDNALSALPAQAKPHVIWNPAPTAQDTAMSLQHVQMPDTGVDLHAGLAKVFPPAQAPNVTLDPNPQHQIEGNLTNRLQADYRKDATSAEKSRMFSPASETSRATLLLPPPWRISPAPT